jgi:ethanolamine ammonia-lyase small subunit
MLTQSQIDAIAEAVLQSMKPASAPTEPHPMPRSTESKADKAVEASEVVPMDTSVRIENTQKSVEPKSGTAEGLEDITSPEVKAIPLLDHVEDREGLERMMARTTARIGVGNCGPRLKTKTMLTLRADHAAARDAVFMDVSQDILDRLGLFTVQTQCTSKNQFLTRPDLGRIFSPETLETIKSRCEHDVDVQIYVSDGLSSTAVEANVENILPILMDGLKARGLKVGTPFFVKNGRVAAMDQISEALNATVTCVLLGERPGLATAESMSAYIAYRATVGMPEARRTVVSNIHSRGIPAVEAGAYIVDVIQKILEAKASGVELKK